MVINNQNWIDRFPYFMKLQHFYNNLHENPFTKEEFGKYYNQIDNDIPDKELKALMTRTYEKLENPIEFFNEIKPILFDKEIISEREFNKLWDKIAKEITEKKDMKEVKELSFFKIKSEKYNSEISLRIESILDGWKIGYLDSNNKYKEFGRILKAEVDDNVLFNSKHGKYQTIKKKFYFICKRYKELKEDESELNQFFEEFIDNLNSRLPEIPIKKGGVNSEKDKKTIEIPEEYKEKINSFLTSERKFYKIEKILDFKIKGEKENKILTFILASGSYAGYFQIILFIADPSGGKSFTTKGVVELFPEIHWLEITATSDKSLIYLDKKKIKILLMQEIQRNLNTLECLKDFGDEGIKYIVTEKDPLTNKYKTIEYKIGKTSIIGTTTVHNLNTELENRAWIFETDMTINQSRTIVNKRLEQEESLIKDIDEEKKFKKQKNLIKFALLVLENEFYFDKIKIPYATTIEAILTYRATKIRRDINKILDLIKIITMWNYRIRESYEYKSQKILLSHPNDLIEALRIGDPIIQNTLTNLSNEKRKILEYLNQLSEKSDSKKSDSMESKEILSYNNKNKKKSKRKKKSWYNTEEIYKEFCKNEEYNKSKRTFRNLLNSLSEDAYLSRKKEGRSNAYKLDEDNMPIFKKYDPDVLKLKCFDSYYTNRKKIIENEKVILHEKKELINKNPGYSKEFKKRIDEVFQDCNTKSLYIENLYQILAVDYSEEYITLNLNILVKLNIFGKNFNQELLKLD